MKSHKMVGEKLDKNKANQTEPPLKFPRRVNKKAKTKTFPGLRNPNITTSLNMF